MKLAVVLLLLLHGIANAFNSTEIVHFEGNISLHETSSPTFFPVAISTNYPVHSDYDPDPRKGNPKSDRPTSASPTYSPTTPPVYPSSLPSVHHFWNETSNSPSLSPIVTILESPELGGGEVVNDSSEPAEGGEVISPSVSSHNNSKNPTSLPTSHPNVFISEAQSTKPTSSPLTTISFPSALTAQNEASTVSTNPTTEPSTTQLIQLPDAMVTETKAPSLKPTTSPSINTIQTTPVPDKKTSLPTGGNQEDNLAPTSLEFSRNQLFSPICSIYFPDKAILDDSAVKAFESTAEQFVTEIIEEIKLPVVINVQGVTVVSQVSSWKRPSRILRAEGPATGLDVYFRIDVLATGYATKEEMEQSFQDLFDANTDVFRGSLESVSLGGGTNSLGRTQMTLIAVAGGSGLVLGILAIFLFGQKKKSRDSKKSAMNGEQPKKSAAKTKYPVQESRDPRNRASLKLGSNKAKQTSSNLDLSQSSASDEMDNMSVDSSFCASLQFCPSIEKREEEAGLFGTQSIKNELDAPCDDEAFNAEWNRREIGTARESRLSNAELNNFDEELRRAEC